MYAFFSFIIGACILSFVCIDLISRKFPFAFYTFFCTHTQAKRQYPFSKAVLTCEQAVQTDAVAFAVPKSPPPLFHTMLPEECVVKILKLLDIESMFSAERVCRRWRKLLLKYYWGELEQFDFCHDVYCKCEELWRITYLICMFVCYLFCVGRPNL